ncbi:hypothetical protein C7R93_26665 [Brevibacillus fortis]|uniref:Uncharacterized protein n=1 Tax=Brevibacillus fortis TaxID=2126352 RepID=A0A2P7UKH3_9BACL|nr:hypothetical protein C7R93_26665 [Brevibacillus fortis]
MQKAKHALKRLPLRYFLVGPLWTRFRFLHGVGQSIPQRVFQEAERFLLFPLLHYSHSNYMFFKDSSSEQSAPRARPRIC